MPLISKPNYNQIFASQAPDIDKPSVFNNYPEGWGPESRPNNGKPTIKGFNYLQQTSDLKDLWILQNGACLPYDESIEYAEGAPVLKDGVIQYKTANGFSPAISEKPYILNYFTEGTSYPLNARVILANGDIVKSTVTANTVNPNVDMTGWVNETFLVSGAVVKTDSLTGLKNITPTANTMRVSIKGYGDGELYWDATSTETANDIDIFQSDRAAVGRWKWVEFKSVAQGGVISDGVTDQTARINQITARMGAIGLRRRISIPPNTKFNVGSVFNNLPVGINLKVNDTVNWGQPPGYRTRVFGSIGSGIQADDSLHMIADNHHPAISLLNTGASGSHTANDRGASILHAVGISYAGDPLNAQILQFNTSATGKWQTTVRALVPRAIALKDPSPWVSGKTYAAGDMCLSDGNKVYVTTSGGTAGATAPTGTGTAINDGGVVWDYYAARRSRDSTVWSVDEDGNAANYGNNYQIRNAANRLTLEVNDSSGDITLRDYTRNNRVILGSNTERGIFNDGVNSVRFSNLSGATPTLVVTGGRVINAAPTTMTGLNLPAGQTSGMCYLHFADANTTLKHGAFQLKGGVDATPPANGFMVFIRNISVGGSWYEVSRSF